MEREQIEDVDITNAVVSLRANIARRLEKHGKGSFASKHEILGILEEEFLELKLAIKEDRFDLNDNHGVRSELMDIAVGCIFGIACIGAGHIK